MNAYQQRVYDEKRLLDEKWIALIAFIKTEQFNCLSDAEKSRMRRQALIMLEYSIVLGERIEAWDE